ncbi:hypothetical protein HYDPIDRAFT_35145 [Hydnomerulius pinastri MD-312]|uniref:Uncharacterized protein n=1 Tax=Hydnomerulius pinastri MD-312 TaxID=994086 RepID=A0A0C2PG13_9AGAM|nr:hypothetical protein HYDPIDRAFT_35145 [Hydnomerulius pinastri MD-312]
MHIPPTHVLLPFASCSSLISHRDLTDAAAHPFTLIQSLRFQAGTVLEHVKALKNGRRGHRIGQPEPSAAEGGETENEGENPAA